LGLYGVPAVLAPALAGSAPGACWTIGPSCYRPAGAPEAVSGVRVGPVHASRRL